jgi:hypothetical protein
MDLDRLEESYDEFFGHPEKYGKLTPSQRQAAAATLHLTSRDPQATLINDAINRFNVAVRKGNRVDMCVAAGMVAATFMQQKREFFYGVWQAIETNACQ